MWPSSSVSERGLSQTNRSAGVNPNIMKDWGLEDENIKFSRCISSFDEFHQFDARITFFEIYNQPLLRSVLYKLPAYLSTNFTFCSYLFSPKYESRITSLYIVVLHTCCFFLHNNELKRFQYYSTTYSNYKLGIVIRLSLLSSNG